MMELSQKILRTALKGVNDLESNYKKFFEIEKLNCHEANFLQTHYLFSYNLKMDVSKNIYKLTISKKLINQRR